MSPSSTICLSSTLSTSLSSMSASCHYIKYKYNNINYMKKNNYIIFILFIVIISFILFIFITEKREGFTLMDKGIGEYQYLAPIPGYNTWSDTTVDQFIAKYNEVNSQDLQKQFIKQWFQIALEDEAKYYISNGMFPICSYIVNYCNNEPTLLNNLGLDNYGNPITLNTFQKFQPNRLIYAILILKTQEKMDPQPDAYLIYVGKKEQPNYNNDIMSNIISYFG